MGIRVFGFVDAGGYARARTVIGLWKIEIGFGRNLVELRQPTGEVLGNVVTGNSEWFFGLLATSRIAFP